MSRMRADAAQVVRTFLVEVKWEEKDLLGKTTGRTANDLTEAELLRLDARMQRRRWRRQPMSLLEVIRLSRQRQRARQTHPGKRGPA
jgi:hypothetical protein